MNKWEDDAQPVPSMIASAGAPWARLLLEHLHESHWKPKSFYFLLCFSNSTWQHVEIVWINSSARKTRIKPQETCVAKWFSTKASPFWPPYSTFSGCSTASRGHRPSSSAPSSFAGIISWVRHLACASVMGLIHCTHLQQNLMSCWGARMSSHLSWF